MGDPPASKGEDFYEALEVEDVVLKSSPVRKMSTPD
jgi:hypothetical protein